MEFEFATASRIIFGPGKLNLIGDLVNELGKKILLISGAPAEIDEHLLNIIGPVEGQIEKVKIDSEPNVDSTSLILKRAREFLPEIIIGIGGGSSIDTAKVISAMLTNPGDITDYMEVIGSNQTFTVPSLPLVAIPTTAGTGSEVTRNAVIGSPSHQVKVSLRSPFLLPRIALIDPELTISLPPPITAYTGLDALTQLIEAYTCKNPNPITDSLCKDGIQRIAHSIYQAYDTGTDIKAREAMSLGALFSGIALANAKLGAVHGFAAPIGGEINAHHGAICASLLANVMETNISVLATQSAGHQALPRYETIGKLLTDDPNATAYDGIQWIRAFCSHTGIKSLSSLGLTETQFPGIIEKAQKASSMKGNPITLSEAELRNILQKSL